MNKWAHAVMGTKDRTVALMKQLILLGGVYLYFRFVHVVLSPTKGSLGNSRRFGGRPRGTVGFEEGREFSRDSMP